MAGHYLIRFQCLQNKDALTTMLLEFGAQFPGIVGPLLEERNKYMVWMLHKTARM